MSRKAMYLCCLMLAGSHVTAAPMQHPSADAAAMRVLIENARQRADSPFSLSVYCTDKKSRRALEIYPGGAAVWNHRLQIRLPWALRRQLLGLLLQNDFPQFEPRYGDTGEPEMDAAVRVSCRISLGIGGRQKSSEQLYDGPQNAELLHLANALLDSVEPLADHGTGAGDLGEGLHKLAAGELDPQLLRLRYVTLPANSGQPGSIVRIDAARLSRQRYTPGRKVGPIEWSALSSCSQRRLLGAIETADIPHIPLNLWSDRKIELHVGVLAYHKTIVARPFTRLRDNRSGPAQQRFAALLTELDKLGRGPDCSPEE